MKIDKLSVRSAVVLAFKEIKVGQEFTGIEFKRMCVRLDPSLKDKYVETFLRLLRYTHRADYKCINRHISKFRRVA